MVGVPKNRVFSATKGIIDSLTGTKKL